MGCPSRKILGKILKVDDGRTSTNVPETRKLILMHKALHPGDGVDRLYLSRKDGRRRLASIEDNVDASIKNAKKFFKMRRKTDCRNQKL